MEHPRKSTCDCPLANGKKIICKHIVAVSLCLDESEADRFKNEKTIYASEEEERRAKKYEKYMGFARTMSPRELREAYVELMTELDMYSSKNPNTTTAAMQAVILEVEMPKDGKVIADFNGKKFEHTLGELLEGSRSHFMIGWLSEAILFNRAMPESCFTVEHYMEDKEPQRDTDYYYVRVRQRDGQWAWSSPIWAERV